MEGKGKQEKDKRQGGGLKREIVLIAMPAIIVLFIFSGLSFAGAIPPPPLNPLPQGEGKSIESSDISHPLTGSDTKLIPSPQIQMTGEGQGGGDLREPFGEKTRSVVIYTLVENFIWQEMVSGKKVLEENGLIYGVGFKAKLVDPSQDTLNAGWELFLGKVNYDGSIQTGEKAVTDTRYLGMRIEADKGHYKRLGNNVYIEPYFGGGYSWWLRNIKDGKTESGGTAVGYTELWQSIYLMVGIRENMILENNIRYFKSIGISYPVLTTNNVRLSEVDSTWPDVRLHPPGQISFNAEVGITKGRLQVLIYYEQMRFSKSPDVSGVFQPESKADIWGLRVGAEL